MSESDEFTATQEVTESPAPAEAPAPESEPAAAESAAEAAPAVKKPARKRAPAKKAAAKKTAKAEAPPVEEIDETLPLEEPALEEESPEEAPVRRPPMVLFQAPETAVVPKRRQPAKKAAAPAPEETEPEAGDDAEEIQEEAPKAPARKRAPAKKAAAKKPEPAEDTSDEPDEDSDENDDDTDGDGGESGRRRRRRGGRRRRRSGGENGDSDADSSDDESEDSDDTDSDDESGESDATSRRRRTRVRQPKNPEDEITSVSGSTRLEAKKQRRREGREAGRRRAPIVSEAEFLARRESVDRVMVMRQKGDLTQIAVLEDKVLVEHYVARESQTSLIGNIYLGKVQNVLPSMEAAFVDIGKGRNAVIYAGEVNWKALGHKDGQQRKIESVLSPGQTILVQVSKDPIGHKGARLTGQISLPGRFLVYVPDGTTSGISRKLPDTERNRLKTLLKEIVPDTAGVIVRTAAEGASEEELTQDVERLTARWADIEGKVKAGRSPELLYGEPDLTLKVVRDLFTEDFGKLVVQGDDAWALVDDYVAHVAPDLQDRLERYDGNQDVFAAYRIDEQIAKGLDRKVWLPSGGSLVIDRTEAMTVIDVNTGKFTGSGGNLEETVTKNNLEAAEEIVRQLRLRDIGGIIVVDFIDMVLESNRDLVLRRLVECLGRDRTRHQVAEVTSLGLVQMTRKRIGTGLLEAFAEDCNHCKGRGVVIHDHPIEPTQKASDEPRGRRSRGGRSRGKGEGGDNGNAAAAAVVPTPKDLAASRPPSERPEEAEVSDKPEKPEGSDKSAKPEAVEKPEVADEPAAEQPAPEQPVQESPAPEPVVVPEQPAEPVAPTVVTTTRRRRAGRPAGPPKAEEAPEPVADATAPEPVQQQLEQQDHEHDEEHHDEHGGLSLLHVPVKKKGSRKR